MQEFFMDYGLWLLIGLLVIIGLVFLLSGKKGDGAQAPVEIVAPPAPEAIAVPVVEAAPPAAPAPAPVADPVVPVAEPAPQPVPVPAPAPAPEPAPVAAPPPVASAPSAGDGADDLLRLKGVGPKLNLLLIELGVTRYAQIAAWTDADIAAIDARLGNFRGRPVRDQWVDQARYLAAGDLAGFEAKYGKL